MDSYSQNFSADCQEEKNEYIDGTACQYLCHVQTATCSGEVYPAHYHYYIEMLYTLSGTFQLYLNGNYQIFSKGDFVLIGSKEVHQITALDKDGGSYIVVRFLPDLIYNGMSQSHFEFKYLLPFITEKTGYDKVIKSEYLANSRVPFWMRNIMEEQENRKYGYELAVKNNIGSIFLWILRYWNANENATPLISQADEKLQSQLAPALTYIMQNYEKSITATQMADLCHMSYSYFSRNFNRLMKMQFSDYLNYIRIGEAEKLLLTSSLSVTEIAVDVGYSTTSYFIKWFRKYKHVSPKQYQKQLTEMRPDVTAVRA